MFFDPPPHPNREGGAHFSYIFDPPPSKKWVSGGGVWGGGFPLPPEAVHEPLRLSLDSREQPKAQSPSPRHQTPHLEVGIMAHAIDIGRGGGG